MTVQELIDELQKVEDKGLRVVLDPITVRGEATSVHEVDLHYAPWYRRDSTKTFFVLLQ